jgi:hypothetical protein
MVQRAYDIPPVCTRTHPRRGDTVWRYRRRLSGDRRARIADLGTSEQVAG